MIIGGIAWHREKPRGRPRPDRSGFCPKPRPRARRSCASRRRTLPCGDTISDAALRTGRSRSKCSRPARNWRDPTGWPPSSAWRGSPIEATDRRRRHRRPGPAPGIPDKNQLDPSEDRFLRGRETASPRPPRISSHVEPIFARIELVFGLVSLELALGVDDGGDDLSPRSVSLSMPRMVASP